MQRFWFEQLWACICWWSERWWFYWVTQLDPVLLAGEGWQYWLLWLFQEGNCKFYPFMSSGFFCLRNWTSPFKLPHDKTNKMACAPAQQRLRSAWASGQSDQSSLTAWRKPGSLATHWVQAKTLIKLGWCPGWSESLLGAQSFCWFCYEVAHLSFKSVRYRTDSSLFSAKSVKPIQKLHLIWVYTVLQHLILVYTVWQCHFYRNQAVWSVSLLFAP